MDVFDPSVGFSFAALLIVVATSTEVRGLITAVAGRPTLFCIELAGLVLAWTPQLVMAFDATFISRVAATISR